MPVVLEGTITHQIAGFASPTVAPQTTSVALPAGVQENDLILVVQACDFVSGTAPEADRGVNTPVSPSGYVSLYSSRSAHHCSVSYKFAGASEGANITVNRPDGGGGIARDSVLTILRFSGVDTGTAPATRGTKDSAAATGTGAIETFSQNHTANNSLAVFIVCIDDSDATGTLGAGPHGSPDRYSVAVAAGATLDKSTILIDFDDTLTSGQAQSGSVTFGVTEHHDIVLLEIFEAVAQTVSAATGMRLNMKIGL